MSGEAPGSARAAALGRALTAGVIGTAAMSVSTWAERLLRPDATGLVDYDASAHVTAAVATVLGRRPHGLGERRIYFALAHWGYGSTVAVAYPLLRRRFGPGWRAPLVLWAGCQSMAFVLLPSLGGTPPPWHWRRDLLLTSVGQHLVYVIAVATTTDVLERRTRSEACPARP